MKRTLMLTMLVMIFSSTSLAFEQPRQQTPIGDHHIIALPLDPVPGCDVGNQNEPVYNYGNWIMGGEVYAYLINPAAEDCICNEGFQLDRVYMRMQFGPEDVPVTFDARGRLAEAVWDPARQVHVPGEVYCSGPNWSITAAIEGLYDINVDIDQGCECATVGDPYFILFDLPNGFAWWPDALEDDSPEAGISWHNSGDGWMDLVTDSGWWGKNIMHADVSCCTGPTASDGLPFGALKSLYR